MPQDLRYALRQLAKSPGFALVAILTLGLAIGSNVAIFSAVDAVLLHPFSYPHPEELVTVGENLTHFNLVNIPASAPEVLEYQQRATTFSQIGLCASIGAFTLTGDGAPETLAAMSVSAGMLAMLGVKPVAGGLFSADAEQVGKDHVALLSDGLWKRRFGSDPSVVGRTVQLNRESYTVLGVVHPFLDFRAPAEVYVPLAFTAQQMGPQGLGTQFVDVIGRLKPGVSIEQSRAEFRTIAAAMQRKFQYKPENGFSLDLHPLVEKSGADLREPLLVLLAAVAVVMLIACANVSNLLLARSILRRREISIRAALGAGRGRVVRQLLTESLVLSLAGGAAGIGLAVWGLHLYSRYGPQGLIRGTQPAVNLWVMGFSIALSVAASVVFGLAPALATSRIDLHDALKEGARGSSSGRRFLRESMVALEVAMSLVLLIGAGLLVRSFTRLERADPGFRPHHLLAATIVLPPAQYNAAAQREFHRALIERIRALPGVTSASAADLLPFDGNYTAASFDIIDHPRGPDEPSPVVIRNRTDLHYFETVGIPILSGRGFTTADRDGSLPVAIIDATVRAKFFPNLDPVGQRISGPVNDVKYTIVGVAGAVKSRNLPAPPDPVIYYAAEQSPMAGLDLVVHTSVDPLSLVAAVRAELARLDPNLPLARVQTEEQRLAASLASARFSIQLMAVFAGIAAALAAIGIYGVLAYLIDQRRRELGIRIALGARAADILGLVLGQGGVSVGIGVAAGIAAAFGATWFLKSLLYEVSATDPLIFGAVSLGLMAVALVAMLVPAARAARVDPIDALRQE